MKSIRYEFQNKHTGYVKFIIHTPTNLKEVIKSIMEYEFWKRHGNWKYIGCKTIINN